MAFMDRFMKHASEPKRDLNALVLALISKGLPRDEIVSNLVQAGMQKPEAEDFYDSIKKEHDGLLKSEMGKAIQDASDRSRQETIKDLEAEVKRMRKDLETQMAMRIAEQREYTDRRTGSLGSEVQSLKSDVFSLKVNTEGEMKVLEREVEEVRLKGFIRVLLSIVTILASAVMAIFGVAQLYNAFSAGVQDAPTLAIYAIVLISAAIFAWLGTSIYTSERKYEAMRKGE